MPFRPMLFACAGLAALAAQAVAAKPPPTQRPVMVTSGELADGFRDRAHCEAVLRGSRLGKAAKANRKADREAGSMFNLAYGNISRCENIAGEYQIVVTPRA